MDSKRGMTATSVVFGVGGLILVTILILTIISTLNNAELLGSQPSVTVTVTNETYAGATQIGGWINQTGYTLKRATNTSVGSFVITGAWNITGAGDGTGAQGGKINTSNYSVSATGIVLNTTTIAPFNNYNNVTISYTYVWTGSTDEHRLGLGDKEVRKMERNFTSGLNNISAKIPTILLVVIIIILLGVLILLIRNVNLTGAIDKGSSL